MLRQFWPLEKVKAWEKELFPNGNTENGLETPSNLICLTPTLHRFWNNRWFALKPVTLPEDKTSLTIQLYWQREVPNKEQIMSLLTKPASTQGLTGVLERGPSHTMWPPITPGDIFELRTDNPEIRPLPSFQILEMQ